MAKKATSLSEEIQHFQAIEITQRGKKFYLLKLPANVLTRISYVAARGASQEQGAVQRILNKRRISVAFYCR